MKTMTEAALCEHYRQMGIKNAIPSFFETVEYGETPDDDWLVTDQRDDVPISGRVRFVMQYDAFWHQSGSGFISDVVENPTWDAIMKIADAMIVAVGDYHHVFVERVAVTGVAKDGYGTYKVATILMGS